MFVFHRQTNINGLPPDVSLITLCEQTHAPRSVDDERRSRLAGPLRGLALWFCPAILLLRIESADVRAVT